MLPVQSILHLITFMVDINECDSLEGSPCPTGSYCLDTNGSFVCSCDAGYRYINRNSQGMCIGKFARLINKLLSLVLHA